MRGSYTVLHEHGLSDYDGDVGRVNTAIAQLLLLGADPRHLNPDEPRMKPDSLQIAFVHLARVCRCT